MKGVVFDVQGTIAHFRRPDTTATQMTYPFITPTAARGLVGAVLGIEDFVTNDKVGIRLMQPVKVVSQQMSMLGKDGGKTFNRPTTIELVINPYYRIYYCGEEHVNQLAVSLREELSVYPTYLGTAYALTRPMLVGEYEVKTQNVDMVETSAVVPTELIEEINLEKNHHYKRAGGFMLTYKGERVFEKSIDFIYEQQGKSISFVPRSTGLTVDTYIARFGEDDVCLF